MLPWDTLTESMNTEKQRKLVLGWRDRGALREAGGGNLHFWWVFQIQTFPPLNLLASSSLRYPMSFIVNYLFSQSVLRGFQLCRRLCFQRPQQSPPAHKLFCSGPCLSLSTNRLSLFPLPRPCDWFSQWNEASVIF